MQPQKGESADSTAGRRVTPEQAAVFAAYDEQDAGTVWYRADPKLLETASDDSRNDEFIWLRDLAARGAAALLRDLDPERTVERIAPRPLLLIGSSDDERVPRASVEALERAAHGPSRSLRFGGRHMLPNDTALLRAITDSTYDWLARVAAPLSPYVPSRHLR
jgi:fermentation-respiration switch protein FrsA (DUF1100 family)